MLTFKNSFQKGFFKSMCTFSYSCYCTVLFVFLFAFLAFPSYVYFLLVSPLLLLCDFYFLFLLLSVLLYSRGLRYLKNLSAAPGPCSSHSSSGTTGTIMLLCLRMHPDTDVNRKNNKVWQIILFLCLMTRGNFPDS